MKGEGRITTNSLGDALASCGAKVPGFKVRDICDSYKDGFISWEDFLKVRICCSPEFGWLPKVGNSISGSLLLSLIIWSLISNSTDDTLSVTGLLVTYSTSNWLSDNLNIITKSDFQSSIYKNMHVSKTSPLHANLEFWLARHSQLGRFNNSLLIGMRER